MSRLLSAARYALLRYPLVTNSVVYGTLYTGAEFSQQTVTRKIMDTSNTAYNFDGLMHVGTFGTFFAAPTLYFCGQPMAYDPHMITRFGVLGVAVYPQIYYYWYKWLDNKFIGKTPQIIMKKLLLDQLLLTPPLLVGFYVAMSLMERQADPFEECRNKFLTTYETSCLFWGPAQILNFMTVPPPYRVVFVASCAFVWVNILCYLKRQQTPVAV